MTHFNAHIDKLSPDVVYALTMNLIYIYLGEATLGIQVPERRIQRAWLAAHPRNGGKRAKIR